MAITVKATKPGFYGSLRQPGDQFEVAGESALSKNWMEPVEAEKPEKPGKAEKPEK